MEEAWLVYLGVLLGTYKVFVLHFCTWVMNMVHYQHVYFKSQAFVTLYFYVLPRASYGNIWYGFIPSVGWRFSNNFPVLLGVESQFKQNELIHFRCRHRCLFGRFYHTTRCTGPLRSVSLLGLLVLGHWDVLAQGHCYVLP